MSFAVVIPSRNAANLKACYAAIQRHEPIVAAHGSGRIWVVDDFAGLDLFDFCACNLISHHFGEHPFIFARNVNIGIQAAFGYRFGKQQHPDGNWVTWGYSDLGNTCDGVILLNDDALLETPGGFTAMAAVAHDHPEYGLIAATTNVTGNLNQLPKGIGLREDPRQVCFICVYIPRTTREKVGLLDERFVDYGCEDDDYCLRVRKAGLKLGIFDGCFVDHGSLTSSFRGGPRAGGDFHPNLKRFIAKWGHDNFGRPCRA